MAGEQERQLRTLVAAEPSDSLRAVRAILIESIDWDRFTLDVIDEELARRPTTPTTNAEQQGAVTQEQ